MSTYYRPGIIREAEKTRKQDKVLALIEVRGEQVTNQNENKIVLSGSLNSIRKIKQGKWDRQNREGQREFLWSGGQKAL